MARDPYDTIRRLAQDREVVVFDLDGVLREFLPDTTDAVCADLGMVRREFLELAFAPELLRPVVTGRATFETWLGWIRDALVERGTAPEAAQDGLNRWVADRGVPVAETAEFAAQLESEGRAVFVFTNGTDNVPAEMRQIGLGHLDGVVLNSADFGVAKPDEAAYAAAHQSIEARLGRAVDPGAVVFTDDREANVTAAREFGWQGVFFDTPARTEV